VLAISALSWVALERPVIGWARRRNARARDERRAPERRRPVPASGGGGVDRHAGGREVSTVRS
jgi:peptidoglycan/LPS O-acetylase OafA/YrhL